MSGARDDELVSLLTRMAQAQEQSLELARAAADRQQQSLEVQRRHARLYRIVLAVTLPVLMAMCASLFFFL